MTDDELIAHLTASRIAGDVATPRGNNLANIDKFLADHPDYWFGVRRDRDWTAAQVLAVMARRVGMDPDDARRHGADRIDPVLALSGLDAAAGRIADVAKPGARVLIATGHPTGLLSMYIPVAGRLAAAGATLLTPADGRSIDIGQGQTWIRYAGPIAVAATGSGLIHTHRAEPMQQMLRALHEAGEAGEAGPDLVIADHGWAGAAADAGLATVGFADTNDPGLFVAAEQGLDIVAVPLDDNVLATTAYFPLADRLTARF